MSVLDPETVKTDKRVYKIIWLGWGQFFVCPTCSSVVEDTVVHDRFHEVWHK